MNNTASEKAKAGVRKWYANHREEFNALRREKYAKSIDSRKKARVRAARYRQGKREGITIDRELYRTVAGKSLRVYTTGQVAEQLECSAQMIRNWEARGWIPNSVFPDSHRLYLKHQVALISKLNTKMANRKANSRASRIEIVHQWQDSILGKW